jgi:soluble lytic murein transglycosylase-like protein
MQLAEGTAEEMGVDDSFDPHDNIIGGAKYLRRLLDRFDGDLTLALAAYNAGPGSVSKYNGVPPFPETQRYVKKVLGQLHSLKKA